MAGRNVSRDCAHMQVKIPGRMVMDVATAEEFYDSLIGAVASEYGKRRFPKSPAPVCFKNVEVIQTKAKILIEAVNRRTEREITHAGFPIHEEEIVISWGFNSFPIPGGIKVCVIAVYFFVRIDTPVSLVPDEPSGCGKDMGIAGFCPAENNILHQVLLIPGIIAAMASSRVRIWRFISASSRWS